MNREIKFRAWHKDLKKMFKIGQITLEKGTWNFEPNDRDFIGMSIPSQPSFVLMQYTGLHDKNGKEIYEGDVTNKGIVKYGINEIDCCGCCYGKHVTIGFYFSEYNEDEETLQDLEVIGNIYDNPELLEGE